MVKRLNSHYSPPLVRSCPVVASGYVDNPSSTADAPPGSSYMPKRQPSSWNTTSSWLRESPGKPCEIFRQLNFRLNCWHLGILCEILVFFHVFSPASSATTAYLVMVFGSVDLQEFWRETWSWEIPHVQQILKGYFHWCPGVHIFIFQFRYFLTCFR